MMQRISSRRFSSLRNVCPQVCIVGSGPAGFYTAQQILKSHPTARIDIYERLPVPFGLVRYGVAPDHPEVKNCIKTFTQATKNERISFLGNISVGSDVTLAQIKDSYHAIVLAYGAAKDRTLNIPGESLTNVLSSRRFVGWYNGLPEDSDLDVNLDVEEAAIIGHGNVAIDVARMLLTSVDVLRKTDIPEPVLSKLSESRIKKVSLIGRRGSHNVSFTIKELREMINLHGTKPLFKNEDFIHLSGLIPHLPRPRKRLLELLEKTALEIPSAAIMDRWQEAKKAWSLRFLLSPKEFIATDNGMSVGSVLCSVNRMEHGKVIRTDCEENIPCGLVLRSIGFTSVKIDDTIPFDEEKGLVPNDNGIVHGHKGLYVSGWVGTGPVGVLLSTMQSGFNTGKLITSHFENGQIDLSRSKNGKEEVLKILNEKGVTPISFSDWTTLDKHEKEEGTRIGKPREKITHTKKMLEIVNKTKR